MVVFEPSILAKCSERYARDKLYKAVDARVLKLVDLGLHYAEDG